MDFPALKSELDNDPAGLGYAVMQPEQIQIALAAIFAAAMSSPLTVTVVSLVKRLPFLSAVPAQQLNLAVAALLSLIYWGAGVLGFSIQLETVAQVILALVPIFAGTLVNYSSNQGVYNSVKGMPIVGYSRS